MQMANLDIHYYNDIFTGIFNTKIYLVRMSKVLKIHIFFFVFNNFWYKTNKLL